MTLAEARGDRTASILDIVREVKTVPLLTQIQAISRDFKLSPLDIAKNFMRLNLGPGHISFPDFVRLRLFDQAFYADASLAHFAGQRRNLEICETVNYRHDWFGMLTNKAATYGYLSAFGLPVIPINAIYAPNLAMPKSFILRDRAALGAFLKRPDSYPLFGKPLEGFQSFGSIALACCIPAEHMLEKLDGSRISIESYISEIEAHYASGYIFQPLVKPSAPIATLSGGRLACLRIVTALTEGGPKVLRAVLKIPAGSNIADNYWRAGNLLAQVDAKGHLLRVTSGAGFTAQHHGEHPDTGLPLLGFEYPDWEASLALAIEGARLMQHVPLIGWDIASTDEGPKIVEMNATPDFFLTQFADRKGMLDDEFNAFMAFQAKNASAYKKQLKTAAGQL